MKENDVGTWAGPWPWQGDAGGWQSRHPVQLWVMTSPGQLSDTWVVTITISTIMVLLHLYCCCNAVLYTHIIITVSAHNMLQYVQCKHSQHPADQGVNDDYKCCCTFSTKVKGCDVCIWNSNLNVGSLGFFHSEMISITSNNSNVGHLVFHSSSMSTT